MRSAIKWSWAALLFLTGLLSWAKHRLAKRGGIIVLTFHRVLPEAQHDFTCSPHGMVVRKETFERLARYVADRYETPSLADGEPKWQSANGKPRLVFTFDDGWMDTARTAHPIARSHGIPLAIFICPDRVGRDFPFWPEQVVALWRAAERSNGAKHKIAQLLVEEHAAGTVAALVEDEPPLDSVLELLKKPPAEKRDRLIGQMEKMTILDPARLPSALVDATMLWSDITAMAEDGVAFGSHTLSHEILPRIPLAKAHQELVESKKAIQKQLGRSCALLAYPNGDCTNEVRELAEEAGYERAFLNQPGIWTKDCDPLLIPRLNIWEGKLVGPSGKFSRIAFEYEVFWKTYRARKIALS